MAAAPEGFNASLQRLIAKFEADKEHYLSKDYPEAQARIDFITPFFKALAWDVDNEAGLLHHEREVIVEKGEAETEGRPDYNFRTGGQTRFFVEAKAPSEPLSATKHILQAKGYAWNTKQVFFVILTDFEEFRFYDASIQPDERKPDEGLLLTLKYTDYLKNAEKLWDFSKDRVAAGSLDAMLPRDRRTQRLRIPVDEAFLDEMTGWREDLARNIYKNNPELSAKQLNEVVQRLLDRIVFIRIAEDRQIIEKNQLREAVEMWQARGGKFHIFDWLNDLFHRINEDFNGEIFKPHLSESIKIDSEVLAKIIERLYPPRSPYRFDVIGVELLGSIYERYLGKTIRPTAKTVRVEERPEARKAGGVYYTPKYIVDYIVKNTVGKVIEGKSPKQIEKIRILDPACGSGSFLIGAFQYLIDYHVRYLTEHPKEAHIHPLFPDLIKGENGEPRLSVIRKARILRNNLYGVDIDPQAVEITMMSLYLKALEGERSQLPPKHALLPELKYNIICGNSLIGPDIYDQGALFGDEERDRINAFDWNSDPDGFGRIMKEGGFNCVIGNPPWVMAGYYLDIDLDYMRARYRSAVGKFDLYYLFIEKGCGLLAEDGRFGMIVPNKFFHTEAANALRGALAASRSIRHVVDFGDEQVFEGATNYSCIVVAGARPTKSMAYGKAKAGLQILQEFNVSWSSLSASPWHFEGKSVGELFAKVERAGEPLARITARFGTGVQTGADRLLTMDVATAKSRKLERELLRRLLKGRDIRRYTVARNPKLAVFPYKVEDEDFVILSEQELRRHKRVYDLLLQNRGQLAQRIWFGRGAAELSGKWYGMMYLDSYASFAAHHILTPSLSDRSNFALGTGDLFATGTAGVTSIVPRPEAKEDIRYILGVLNSLLISFYVVKHSPVFSGGYYKFSAPYLKGIPIRLVDFSDPADKARHDKLVALVQRMLELNYKMHSGKLAPSEVERVERDIASTDQEIDELVYEMYGITDEERRIIEAA